MHIIRKFRNVMRGVLQAWGAASIKRKLWNSEFSNGRWDYIENTPDDCVYAYIGRYGGNGNILDLGCGSGNTGNELDSGIYQGYTGIDVSDVAVQKARARSQANGRFQKNQYFQSDVIAYIPTSSYNLILFRESIMYIPHGKIKTTLDRYSKYLEPGGVFVVRMCDREKYRGIVQVIKEGYEVVDEYLPEQAKTIVIAFRPTPAAKSRG